MATITFKCRREGSLADADVPPAFCSQDNVYGIKRSASGVVVVAAHTALTKISTGVYSYTFTPPEVLVSYTAWIKVIMSRRVSYYEIVFVPPAEVVEVSNSPSSVLAKYLIDTLGVFTTPGESGDWPLYQSSLPDGSKNTPDAAIYDTTPVVDAKLMNGSLVQMFGIQLRVRGLVYETVYRKLDTVVTTLADVHGVQVAMPNSYVYEIVNISIASTATFIGPDEKRRNNFTANLLLRMKTV